MIDIADRVRELIRAGDIRISEHGYDEMADDGLTVKEVLSSINDAVVVEEYPEYPKGPCVLFLQKDKLGDPIHVVWGIPKGHEKPVVLITAYRPDPARWDYSFIRRL